MNIRPAAIAGYFYPADSNQLIESIQHYFNTSLETNIEAKAIIAPHAGHQYSGSIAATAYKTILHRKENIERVVILGPAHRVFVKGIALSSADMFATPLGNIDIDQAAQSQLLELDFIQIIDEAHKDEHCLEVHLPFLQSCLNEFSLIPLIVGETSPQQVSDVIELLWNDKTLIMVSSDLSHFHTYEFAKQVDQNTSDAIENFQIENIGPKQACGCRPLNGLLTYAKKHSYQVKSLEIKNSGDTSGNKERVVGYGAYAII